MKTKYLIGISFIISNLSFSPVAAQVGEPYIHDPSTIAECEGKYYTFGTGGGGLISEDGWSWHSGADRPGGGAAPDVMKIGDRYLCIYGATGGGLGGGAYQCVVSNCVVTGAETCRSDYGAVHVSGTGLLTHTVIRNSNCNKSTSSGAVQSGAGLALSGNGVAEYCMISNCYAEGAAGSRGGGAYVMGGVLRDSSIFNCQTSSSSDAGGALSQTGGLVERCVIGESATRKNGGAAIYQTGGTMRNCLVKGFVAKSTTQVLQLSGSGSFVNNTVVTNGFGSAATSPVAATVAGGISAKRLTMASPTW